MRGMAHVKRARVKGREYLYFRTGQKDAKGKEILAPLPSRTDPGFGDAYASFMAARTRRRNAQGSPELTVTRLCELYEASPHFRGLSTNTKRVYRGSLDYFRKMLPTAPAGHLQRQDVVLLLDGRADRPGAANMLLKAIGALFKWARARGHVSNDPGRDVELFDLGEHEPWPEELLQAALTADNERVRLGTNLLFYTGQRIGDVCKMRWTDVPREGSGQRRLKIVQQKTGKEVEFPVHPALTAELDRYPQRLGYILGGANGRALNPNQLREALQAFAKDLGNKVVPHGLRKNAVNAMLEAGCSVAETAAITGQSLKMVEHYAKARSQPKLAAAAVLKWQRHKG